MKRKLLSILKKEAFCQKKVRLSSGRISDFYIDVRKVSLSSEGIYLISNLILRMIKGENISAIGGPTLGADPIVSGVCFLAHQKKRKLKGFLIRKSPKKYGSQKMLEGKPLKPSDRVLVVDDVATSGSSIIKAVKVLKEARVKVVKALVIVDREEGAAEELAKSGCPFSSIFTKRDFFSAKKS